MATNEPRQHTWTTFTMTTQLAAATAGGQYRAVGKAAIVIGVVALGTLIAAIVYLYTSKSAYIKVILFFIGLHGAGIILQSLFMIPAAFALHALARQQYSGMSRMTLAVGVAALSLIRKIRRLATDMRNIPAIAVTAFVRPEERLRALEAGYNLQVGKRVNCGELLSSLTALLHEPRADDCVAAPGKTLAQDCTG